MLDSYQFAPVNQLTCAHTKCRVMHQMLLVRVRSWATAVSSALIISVRLFALLLLIHEDTKAEILTVNS